MLSEALQRNAKPRKRYDFGYQKDGLYAAKHEARLSNISGMVRVRDRSKIDLRFFASLRMTLRL
jgi:hypothetical protein